MTVGQKATVSLLASTLLAAGFAALAYSGLFSVIETRFFDERVKRSVESSVEALSASADAYHALNADRFSGILGNDYVRRSFLPNQSAQDAFDRTRTFGLLAEETPGLLGVRFVDLDGKRIHFSTFPGDVIRSESLRIVYRNYGEPGDEPYVDIEGAEGSKVTVSALPSRRAFAYRFPFMDGFGVYRGSAVFYVTFTGFLQRLIQDGRIALGDDIVAVGTQGVLAGAPAWGGEELLSRIASIWASGPNAEPVVVGSSEASGSFMLFTVRGEAGLVGRLVPSSWFEMPDSFRWLLLTAFFITVYLSLFLVLNLRQDRFAVLATRIKRFQIELLEEYLERKGDMDVERWKGELEARRGETRERIRKSAGRLAKKRASDIDALIDKSWDEIIAVMTSRGERPGGVDMARFEALLKEALSKGSFVIGASQSDTPRLVAPAPSVVTSARVEPETIEDVEELAELDEAEELEELEEIEAAEEAEEPAEAEAELAEDVEELAELEEAEEAAEEIEEPVEAEAELAEDVEELAELEEAEEAVEEAEEPAEAELAEETVEPAEAELAEDVEELDELEEAEEAVEEAEEPVEVEVEVEAEPAEDVEELAELEEAEEAAEDIEELEELEELPETAIAETLEWGSLSAEALALAMDDEDDLPIIPESLGLELVEETDLADIIGYLDSGSKDSRAVTEDGVWAERPMLEEANSSDDEAMTKLVFTSPLEELAETVLELDDDPDLPTDTVEVIQSLEEKESVEASETAMYELLEEVEFDLFLNALDLSGLDGYSDDDGFLELDDSSFSKMIGEPIPAPDYSVEDLGDEISMLSDEQRERIEELQPVEIEDSEATDVEPLIGSGYRQILSAISYHRRDMPTSAIEELPIVAETEPDEALPVEERESSDVIVMVDGIYTINREGIADCSPEDRSLKALADSVLAHRGA
ncbi:MAG: hypothetical protein CVV47_09655 [Spirochaetae bacterium HGW-Spirochaetae-3]|nr:MAG: hypothetical protein CVV47_09655 [Spirochaetae bacterium HGW-Spirochaetae-3]